MVEYRIKKLRSPVKNTLFVRGLIAALRYEGVEDFTKSNLDLIIDGLEAAIVKAEEKGINFKSHERVILLNTYEFFSIGYRYGLIKSRYNNGRTNIQLSKEGAEDYFKCLFPDKYFETFRECAKACIKTSNELFNKQLIKKLV